MNATSGPLASVGIQTVMTAPSMAPSLASSSTELVLSSNSGACEWGRACWSHQNSILYGECKDQYKITKLRLKAEAQVWMDAPIVETLIPIQGDWWKRKLLKKAAISDIALYYNLYVRVVNILTFRYCVLASTQQNLAKFNTKREGPEYSSDIDFT